MGSVRVLGAVWVLSDHHAQETRKGKKPDFSYRCWMNKCSEVKLYNCRVGADITNAAYLV